MPYKDKEKQKQYQRRWSRNKFSDPNHRQNRLDRQHDIVFRNRQKFAELKTQLRCTQCGENHPACLDFHHIDPSNKNYTVSEMMTAKFSWETIQKEIDKCIVLCANCHRKHHWDEAI